MNERAHCPYLGLRQNRAIRFAAPTAEHRCYVAGDAQEIPVDQRAYCLSGDHRTCPLYTGDWGATTSSTAGAGATLALTSRGQRVRSAGRDTLFYLLVVSLVLTITAIWLGIGYLYTLGGAVQTAAASAPAVIVFPTSTPEPTVEPTTPTTTATVIATPPAPQGPTAVLDADRVVLDWQPGPPPLTRGYNIQRSDRARGPWIRLNGKLHTFSRYEDSGLQPNTQYFYRITTVDRNGRESQATRISVRTLASTPTPTATPTPEPTVPPFVAPVYIPLPAPPFVPPTLEPPTPEPPTPEPPTPEPPTPEPPTAQPVPPEAPTLEPPVPEPTSEVPLEPTLEPPTPEPPTPEPPTPEPPTPEPPTPQP